jgi:hypothetical protein
MLNNMWDGVYLINNIFPDLFSIPCKVLAWVPVQIMEVIHSDTFFLLCHILCNFTQDWGYNSELIFTKRLRYAKESGALKAWSHFLRFAGTFISILQMKKLRFCKVQTISQKHIQ